MKLRPEGSWEGSLDPGEAGGTSTAEAGGISKGSSRVVGLWAGPGHLCLAHDSPSSAGTG